MFRVILVLAALALTGCAAPQTPAPDAADASSRWGDLVSRYDVPVTGRDWNCKTCYR